MNNSISPTGVYLESYKNKLRTSCPQYGTAKIAFSGNESTPKDDNNKLMYAVGGVLVGAGVTGLLALAGKGKNVDTSKFTSEISDLKKQVRNLTREAENLGDEKDKLSASLIVANDQSSKIAAELEEQRKLAAKLQAKLNSILQDSPQVRTNYVDELLQGYRKTLLSSENLDYDPMKPIQNGEPIKKSSIRKYISFQKIDEPAQFIRPAGSFDANEFIARLERIGEGETLEIPFAQSEKIRIKKAEDAAIQQSFIQKIGIEEDCDKAMLAGRTTKWSKEKLARDILQNFYDGHGHTLDGVKMTITRAQEGKYKVRIQGQSTYNCKYIAGDGLSSKSENLYDAGGFGEGLKMVNVQMLARNISDKISYGSADWKYDITAGDEFMRRKLTQVPNFDGNFVEFETKDKEFLEKLLNATNYFEHSKNPDFNHVNLIYQNGDMGIAFLGKDKKGHLYMTQRFAYGTEDGWESLDGLNLFFRKKPDAKFNIGRDRNYFDSNTLKNLIDSFTEDISNDDALDIIMKMQSVWEIEPNRITNGATTPAYKILLESLCKKLGWDTNSKKIDLTQQKFVAVSSWDKDRTRERLEEYGYTICDDFFEKIGMPTASQVLGQYSSHNPLKPTATEIKKIKILGEAAKVVQQVYEGKLSSDILQKIAQEGDLIGNGGFDLFNRTIENGNFIKIKEILETLNKKRNQEIEKLSSRKFQDMKERFDLEDQIDAIYNNLIIKTFNEKFKNIHNCDAQTRDELISLVYALNEKRYFPDKISKKIKKCVPTPIIKQKNPNSPIFIFDRTAENAENTLAEAMVKNNEYLGHWVSRDHLKDGSFTECLATWLHEMCHQYAGDSDSRFGYKLTDLLGDTFTITPEQRCKLSALKKLYDEVSKTQQ